MNIKVLIEKVTEALHRDVKGERLPRSIIFESITDLSQALHRAKNAHAEFERGLGAKDCNWPLWYAAYMAMEQWLLEKSPSTLPISASKFRPVQKIRYRLKLLTFFIFGRS
jgi:hypothetical protein